MGTIKSGLYRHFKGMEYLVESAARHSESMEEFVVYRALYGECGLWVRPLNMFKENVVVGGEEIPRFQRIGTLEEAKEKLARLLDERISE
ncbi:DUF1653 domain-containing protein [Marinomonas sp. 15G1-11]|uniref:DUF1653 domain-containing protein n=1 Tax=Marinomonas phaeophyticola TaxID=3004091 RepID=A0ABT4JSR4_9GAMM|nr:DUF1653 domain-containing protein [Marinomonas sp. 15G1-11]MCZ2721431.1 DUF1653 domain-containing protein [Marinomonas sp. 15G1-11]